MYALPETDPVTANYPLSGSPWPMLGILGAYYAFIKLGNRAMQKRRPFDLTNLMIGYNFALVILSVYIVVEIMLAVTAADYNLFCENYKRSSTPQEVRVANVLWWYFASKSIELLDTVFMVLRKKTNQITFLHLYHHMVMFPAWYLVVKVAPGGSAFVGPFFNSIIHVVMYLYYGLAAIPAARRFLWWKKYLTQLQMTQFLVVLAHNTYLVYKDVRSDSCFQPRGLIWFLEFFMVSLFALFYNFYRQSYKKRRAPKISEVNENEEAYQNGTQKSERSVNGVSTGAYPNAESPKTK